MKYSSLRNEHRVWIQIAHLLELFRISVSYEGCIVEIPFLHTFTPYQLSSQWYHRLVESSIIEYYSWHFGYHTIFENNKMLFSPLS